MSRKVLTPAADRSTLRGMSENRYWSVEDCCWMTLPAREAVEATAVEVPVQREDEPVQEPVDA
jgi:hypothetical protein